MSWKSIMVLPDGERASNACRYATKQQAFDAGAELMGRWFVPTGHDVEESEDPVNYRFTAGQSQSLPTRGGKS